MLQVRHSVFDYLRSLSGKVARLRVPKAIVADIPHEQAVKLDWLQASNSSRDFQKLTPQLKDKIRIVWEKRVRSLLNGNSQDFDAPWVDAGVEYLRGIANRILDGDGGDVKMLPLSASTIASKKAAGDARPSAIGYGKGNLYRALKEAITERAVRALR